MTAVSQWWKAQKRVMSDKFLKDIVERAFETEEARTAQSHTTEEFIEKAMRTSETRMERFCDEVRRDVLGIG